MSMKNLLNKHCRQQ